MQERLGHTSIRTSMDTYWHLIRTVEDDHDRKMNDRLRWHGRGKRKWGEWSMARLTYRFEWWAIEDLNL